MHSCGVRIEVPRNRFAVAMTSEVWLVDWRRLFASYWASL